MALMPYLVLTAALLGALAVPQALGQTPRAPFVATPPDVVDRMLALANVGPRDVVYDLGCGDGRIVIAAAQKFGARGVGIDIDPARIYDAEQNARKAGVERLVRFEIRDALKTDVSDATVVTLYLLSALNVQLRPILTRQLRPGARIVSHSFAMGDWEPDVVDTFTSADGLGRTLYLWKADGKVRP
jgi:SAM-dependent methyltransferase